jgi:hypothetical protein
MGVPRRSGRNPGDFVTTRKRDDPTQRERPGIPARHPATQPIWAWLQSRTVQELTTEKRDEIAGKLMDLDAELWTWEPTS